MRGAAARLRAATTPVERDEARTALEKARYKATARAIKRSVFSICAFQLEDTILNTIDEHLRQAGWVVASLIFDGVLVEHRGDASLDEAIRSAQQAVRKQLGYEIELHHEELLDCVSATEEILDAGEEEDLV